jgi:hypothetical protein
MNRCSVSMNRHWGSENQNYYMTYHFISIRMGMLKKQRRKKISIVDKNMKKSEYLYTAGRRVK